ncbi:MAG: aminoglycoside 6-adenylyltransferase [Streptococcus sp.]
MQIAESASGSSGFIRIEDQSTVPKDEFQDYDVVYIVENLNDLLSDLSLDQLDVRLNSTMSLNASSVSHAFEDGNRIDLTSAKEYIQEWWRAKEILKL